MATVTVRSAPVGGFEFGNCRRNALLEKEFTQKGHKLPAARKTGTTIAGVVFKDGVVLGADTRATEGMVVADKNCSKIHYIAPNVYCCGAGTAADTEMTTQMISSNMELHSLSTGRLTRVSTANRMLKQMLFRYQGYIGAALVLGGVDCTGPHLYSIYPHGSTDKLPYVTMEMSELAVNSIRHKLLGSAVDDFFCINKFSFQMLRWAGKGVYSPRRLFPRTVSTFSSPPEQRKAELIYAGKVSNRPVEKFVTNRIYCSGSLAAMAVFEDRYRPDLEEDEAKLLVRDAIASGIFNDLGSGSNIDLCVITKNKVDYIRPHDVANKKGVRTGNYKYKKGTTGVLSEKITHFNLDVMEESVQTMDIS